jgi:hypothetical protein
VPRMRRDLHGAILRREVARRERNAASIFFTMLTELQSQIQNADRCQTNWKSSGCA